MKKNETNSLNQKTLELINSLKGKDKIKVLFVCLGNICRSPAAEGVLKEIVREQGDEGRWEIDSAGTGGWHAGQLPDSRMRLHARQRGLNLNHTCRRVTESDFDEFDLIVPMDAQNLLDLRRMAPDAHKARKLVPMAFFFTDTRHYDFVPDPYYEGSEGFELVLDLLQDACHNLYETLK